MKLNKKMENKLKSEGLKAWNYWYDIFLTDKTDKFVEEWKLKNRDPKLKIPKRIKLFQKVTDYRNKH